MLMMNIPEFGQEGYVLQAYMYIVIYKLNQRQFHIKKSKYLFYVYVYHSC